MTVNEHLSHFAGLSVTDVFDEDGRRPRPADVPGATAWRVRYDWKRPFPEIFQEFLDTVDAARLTHLVTGWDDGCDTISLLAEHADRLPALRHLFVGDVVYEESEISWIEREDITRLVEAFPRLETLEVRGGTLRMRPFAGTALRRLRLETGGMAPGVVRAITSSDLPNLEHLDLWLGAEEYGGDVTAADLAPILSGERFPSLRRLGLEDAEIADEIAAALASAPIVARLESLSLALGALTDEGAEALLSGQPLTHLRRLDLHHHFLSDAMMQRVRQALPGVEVDLDEQKESGGWPYVAVSE
ncbi:hypothetical protein Arub01_49230 [Actinomadura rubrobrunea]|uniref:Leucine-rich repeat domain-containing protein n=1 Tax=Actinomadura rubrobrunea TaxID=115335 RepID=A0A9W6UWX4_9ACTN|nr:STM4015 family protein [Actinomadura rubrobrunea]GLW66679.1 hypothetical protein Arub01_49230 [Actinomadura rubrobrunea]